MEFLFPSAPICDGNLRRRGFNTACEEELEVGRTSVHGESIGASPSFDIPPLAGDEVQDKSVQDESEGWPTNAYAFIRIL